MMNLKFFRKTLLAILLLVPFICSAATILIFEKYPSQNVREACGFSGVSSATVGVLIFCFALFAAFEKGSLVRDDTIHTHFIAFFCAPYYFLASYFEKGYILIILPFIPIIKLMWKYRRRKEKLGIIFITSLLCVVITYCSSKIFFPYIIIQNKIITNVFAHSAGFIPGIFLPILFCQIELQKQRLK